MNIDFVDSTQTVGVPLYILIIAGIVLLIIIIALMGVIVFLFRKVKSLTKMRYGFGGKPLFSILIVIGLVVMIPLTLYASRGSLDIVRKALMTKDVIVQVQEVEKTDEVYTVSFIAIPSVDGELWGDETYTIRWVVEGPTSLEFAEEDRDKDNPSYEQKELLPGEYTITVYITNTSFDESRTVRLTLE